MDRCDDCGFVFDELATAEIPGAIHSGAAQYRERLVGSSVSIERLRHHSEADVWSPLEYACHMRDVFEVQANRVAIALVEDEPGFVPMGREERVLDLRYNEQDPAEVADAIEANAEDAVRAFAALTPQEWQRTAVYSWPTTQVRTLAWVGRNTVHEAMHHLRDIDGLLAAS
jgi:hypothetical protein